MAVHRLRRRYRALLREEIAQTLDDPAGVEDEIRALFAALAPEKNQQAEETLNDTPIPLF